MCALAPHGNAIKSGKKCLPFKIKLFFIANYMEGRIQCDFCASWFKPGRYFEQHMKSCHPLGAKTSTIPSQQYSQTSQFPTSIHQTSSTSSQDKEEDDMDVDSSPLSSPENLEGAIGYMDFQEEHSEMGSSDAFLEEAGAQQEQDLVEQGEEREKYDSGYIAGRVYDLLHLAVPQKMSATAFEALLAYEKETLQEFLPPAVLSLWPTTMAGASRLLRDVGMSEATTVYTCLKADHWCNMLSPTDCCSTCGSLASDGMKWLWIGRCLILIALLLI